MSYVTPTLDQGRKTKTPKLLHASALAPLTDSRKGVRAEEVCVRTCVCVAYDRV